MKIELCRKSLARLATDLDALQASLREREHHPLLRDCLNRCQRCDLGFVIASADGLPLGAATIDELLAQLDALAAEES